MSVFNDCVNNPDDDDVGLITLYSVLSSYLLLTFKMALDMVMLILCFA